MGASLNLEKFGSGIRSRVCLILAWACVVLRVTRYHGLGLESATNIALHSDVAR